MKIQKTMTRVNKIKIKTRLKYPKIIKHNKHKHDIKQEQFRQTMIFKIIIGHMADDQKVTKTNHVNGTEIVNN